MEDIDSIAQPTWFGSENAPLFGVVHVPKGGSARAGVVICPPLGKEHVDSYRGLKLLAQLLCARGFMVLRFDYLGTGDSALEQDSPRAVTHYRESIAAAVAHLQAGGVADVALVGLRAGALLAADVVGSLPGVRAVVLWDPVTDGRRFMREQRALYKMSAGADAADSAQVSILGLTFAPEAAADLRALTLPGSFAEGVKTLAVVRPDRTGDPAVVALAASRDCTVKTVIGQEAFVEPASFVVEIPIGALYAVSSWLDNALPLTRHPVAPVVRLDAVVGDGIRETLESLGPDGLFAIRTTSPAAAADAPATLIHNTACEHRVGPGRVWVETARELAGAGMTVLRYDRRGTGETGTAELAFPRMHSKIAKIDVLHAMAATGVPADQLMMTGVCSGAWDSAYGALSAGARSVVMVNLLLYSLRNVEVGQEELSGSNLPAPGDVPNQNVSRAVLLAKQLVRRWLPYQLWLLAGRLGLTQAPEVLLKALYRAGVSVDLVLSPEDYAWFEKQRGGRGIDRLEKRGWSDRVIRIGTGDHSLLQRDIQNLTRMQLLDTAEREFAGRVSRTVVSDADWFAENGLAHWRPTNAACRDTQL